MTHGSLFSGIGGFDLAAQWMGWENVLHCEINPFGRQVLNYYWPNAISYEDITKTDFTIHRGSIDVLTGGFPCQPFSLAGKRKGTEDERHLWPEMLRAIREIQPRWIVGENVFGLVNWDGGLVFEQVQADLEAEGYEVQPYILPAASVNAPHRRDRVWFVAHCSNTGIEGVQPGREDGIHGFGSTTHTASIRCEREFHTGETLRRHEQTCGKVGECDSTNGFTSDANIERRRQQLQQPRSDGSWPRQESCGCSECYDANTEFKGLEGRAFQKEPIRGEGTKIWGNSAGFHKENYWHRFPTQPPVCGGDDGLPAELDGITFSKWRNESIKAYGNAIVPQVVLQILKAIQEYDTPNMARK